VKEGEGERGDQKRLIALTRGLAANAPTDLRANFISTLQFEQGGARGMTCSPICGQHGLIRKLLEVRGCAPPP
jgi:hypothetical protein